MAFFSNEEVEHRKEMISKCKQCMPITPAKSGSNDKHSKVVTLNSSTGRIVKNCESKENTDKKLAIPFIEDESMTRGDTDDIKNCDELYKTNSMAFRLNVDCKIKGNSSGTWACLFCFFAYNSVISDSRCKSCSKGINPYYFISNENDPVDRYPFLWKNFGLVEGQMVVRHHYGNATSAGHEQWWISYNGKYLTVVGENLSELDLQNVGWQWYFHEFGRIASN